MPNIKRANTSGITKSGVAISDVPDAPIIGSATAVDSTSATVAYTAATTGGTATTFTATSTPGSLTGTGSSPITVAGLTELTSYTFTVRASNSTGNSPYSASSNSITTLQGTAFESIATYTVASGGQSSIVFSSIPSTYTHLQIRGIGRDSSSHNAYLFMRFNSDTNANYARHYLGGNGANASSNGAANVTIIGAPYSLPSTASIFGASVIDILDYRNASKFKTVRGITGWDNNGGTSYGHVELFSGLWRDTSAITSIELSCESTFAEYSQFALYGIKGA